MNYQPSFILKALFEVFIAVILILAIIGAVTLGISHINKTVKSNNAKAELCTKEAS